MVRWCGEGQGGMAVEESTRRVVSMAVPSRAQHTELMGCQHQHHSRENQHPNCTACCEASIWEKIPHAGQWFSFDDGSEKLLLQIGWGKVLSVDSVLAKHFTGFG